MLKFSKIKILILKMILVSLTYPGLDAKDHFTIWESYKIDVQEINQTRKEILEETIQYLKSQKKRKILIDKKIYQKYSTFEKYFQFPFNGEKLTDWVFRRIQKIKIQNTNSFMAVINGSELFLHPKFFSLSSLDQIIVLIHEARHTDGDEFTHVRCPENFRFLSQRNENADLTSLDACDNREDGAYGLTAAFLFELVAMEKNEKDTIIGKYNSELSRIIHVHK